jgi:hypothetical protein
MKKPYLGHNIEPACFKVVVPKDTLQQIWEALVKKASQVVPAHAKAKDEDARECVCEHMCVFRFTRVCV